VRAAVLRAHGRRENLSIEKLPRPIPGAGEVLVRVHACALNHLDVLIRREGRPRVRLPHIGGADVAGEVFAHGPGVGGPALGERVVVYPIVPGGGLGYRRPGGLAEYVVVPAETCIPIPDEVAYRDAAALPVAYGTARRALTALGKLEAHETVAILGASGGVGLAGVQLAKLAGASVIAVITGERKVEAMRQLNADGVIDRTRDDWSNGVLRLTGDRGADVVLDPIGAETWEESVRCCARGGRLLCCGFLSGYSAMTDLRYVLERELQILGVNGFLPEDIVVLLELVRSRRLRPVVHAVLPLEQVAEGHRLLEAREAIGKVVIEP